MYAIPAGLAAPPRSKRFTLGQRVLLACSRDAPGRGLFTQLLGVKTLFFSNCPAGEELHALDGYLRIGGLREGMRAWEQVWRLVVGGPHRPAAAGSGQHD